MKILYEDNDCFVVDKPANILVHPAEGKKDLDSTLVGAFLNKINWDDKNDLRPGVVHRLDKDTSGVLLMVRNRAAYNNLIGQFKNRTVKKSYLALVRGIPEHEEAVIDSPVGRSLRDRKKMALSSESLGKNAVSEYKVIKKFDGCSLLRVRIKTGRTHQIRVHMAAIGHPVIGDEVYGDKKLNKMFREKFGLERQFLHAEMLKFKSPGTGKNETVKSELPEDLQKVLDKL